MYAKPISNDSVLDIIPNNITMSRFNILNRPGRARVSQQESELPTSYPSRVYQSNNAFRPSLEEAYSDTGVSNATPWSSSSTLVMESVPLEPRRPSLKDRFRTNINWQLWGYCAVMAAIVIMLMVAILTIISILQGPAWIEADRPSYCDYGLGFKKMVIAGSILAAFGVMAVVASPFAYRRIHQGCGRFFLGIGLCLLMIGVHFILMPYEMCTDFQEESHSHFPMGKA